MITEEKYLEAKKIVTDYETGLLVRPFLVTSLPDDTEIRQQSLLVSKIEGELVQSIAWCYHDKGAKWMKQEIIKRNQVICKHEGCLEAATCKEYCGSHCECFS